MQRRRQEGPSLTDRGQDPRQGRLGWVGWGGCGGDGLPYEDDEQVEQQRERGERALHALRHDGEVLGVGAHLQHAEDTREAHRAQDGGGA
jgi:hypothetical protein